MKGGDDDLHVKEMASGEFHRDTHPRWHVESVSWCEEFAFAFQGVVKSLKIAVEHHCDSSD